MEATNATNLDDVRYQSEKPMLYTSHMTCDDARERNGDMRVWIIGAKRWGDSGEVAWEVEWYGFPPVDPESGESEIDAAPRHVRWFKTEAAAMQCAEKEAGRSDNWGGSATVQKMGLEQIAGNSYDWEPIGSAIDVYPKCAA